MNVAINFHSADSPFRRETVGLKRHSQRKAQHLLSKKTPDSRPENSSGDLKPHKPDTSSFSEAIRLAQQGDAEAFEIIYQRHSGRVYALCLRMLRDPVEAEDRAQEVFIQLFRTQDSYLSWRIRVFDVAASLDGEPCSDAPAQEEADFYITR